MLSTKKYELRIMDTKKETKQNQTLIKALSILEAMTNFDHPVRLQDIAEKVSLAPATVLRLVNTFIDKGYIRHSNNDERFYQLTYKLAIMGNRTKLNFSLKTLLEKYLLEVVNKFNEAASISIESDMQMVYIASEVSNTRIMQALTRVGKIGPMHATAGGKLNLLNHDWNDIVQYSKNHGLIKYTNMTISTLPELKKELSWIKEHGYALDREEFEIGLRCVSVPVYDMTNKIIAAINLSGSATFVNESNFDRIVPFMLDISRKASEDMGYTGLIPAYRE